MLNRNKFLNIEQSTQYFVKISLLLFLTIYIPSRANLSDNTISAAPVGTFTCPLPSALIQDAQTKIWSAPGGWKSFSSSFASHLDSFLGAQWVGVGVGKITCIYQPTDKLTFPVTLQLNRLVYAPIVSDKSNKNKWSKNLGGYQNCISSLPADCYFVPLPIQKIGSVYDEAQKLYHAAPEEPGF